MVTVEEFAQGIIIIEAKEKWTLEIWQNVLRKISILGQNTTEPLYLLFNLTSVTQLDESAFRDFLLAPHYGSLHVVMAIMVGRRAQVNLAREIINTQSPQPDRVQLRLMYKIEDAGRFLLDRQVMDRMEAKQRIQH